MPSDQEGFFELCLRASNVWHENFYEWPTQRPQIINDIISYRDKADVFFSPSLFNDRCSQKQCVLPPISLFSDVDAGDIFHAPLIPTVCMTTSPGRRQASWKIARNGHDVDYIEMLSRKITYSIEGADRSGWGLGHKMRVPDTYNYKYLDGPFKVEVESSSLKTYSCEDIELLDDADAVTLAKFDPNFIENPPTSQPSTLGPQSLLDSVRDKIPARCITEYNIEVTDRSAALWVLMCSLFRAGLSREEVYWVAKHSANNKFSKLQYHAERELAKDVLRAEQEVSARRENVRLKIIEIKHTRMNADVRNSLISKIVENSMKQNGVFVKTSSNEEYYIKRDQGRPIYLTKQSMLLDSLLNIQYGLNSHDSSQQYVKQDLIDYAVSLPHSVSVANLSSYDQAGNVLLIHTGSKDVYAISPNAIDKVTDGSHGILFPWQQIFEPFSYIPVDQDWNWAEDIFGDLAGLVDYEHDEALLLLKVYTIFLYMRSAALSRPILAFFGQPGGGKTTTMTRLVKTIYGQRAGMSTLTSPEAFDNLTSTMPFVAFDGIDSYIQWLPDKLSQSSSVTDYTKRRLFSDNETVRYRRAAMVGITAHNPRFMREDIADRLLMFNFKRLNRFQPETPMYLELARQRSRILSGILQDLQKVLRVQPLPFSDLAFRVEDFARIGEQISIALDKREQFRAILKKLSRVVSYQSLAHADVLLKSIKAYLYDATLYNEDKYYESQELYDLLLGFLEPESRDVAEFKKIYKNASYLGRKLWILQAALKASGLKIDWKNVEGKRLWNIKK